jgi:hypothetical protein
MSGSCLSENPDPEFRKFLRTRNKICPTRDAKTPIIFAQDWYKIGNCNHQTCVLSKSKLLSSRLLFSRQLLNSKLYKFLYKKKCNLVIWNYHNSLSNFVFWVVMKTNKEQTNKQTKKRRKWISHLTRQSFINPSRSNDCSWILAQGPEGPSSLSGCNSFMSFSMYLSNCSVKRHTVKRQTVKRQTVKRQLFWQTIICTCTFYLYYVYFIFQPSRIRLET